MGAQTELMTLRSESWSCTYFNHHAFSGAQPRFLPSEVTFRSFLFSENPSRASSTADTTAHVIPASLAPPCHIPACLAPTAAACTLLHRRAQLAHTCTPSSPNFLQQIQDITQHPQDSLWMTLKKAPQLVLSPVYWLCSRKWTRNPNLVKSEVSLSPLAWASFL